MPFCSLIRRSSFWYKLAQTLPALCLSGCGFASTRVQTLAAGAEPPGNVALYISVVDGDTPVEHLKAENFRVVENGQELTPTETGQVLIDRQGIVAHRTLLLVDVSAATPEEVRRELRAGSEVFADIVRRSQPVSLYVFDGSPSIRPLADFDRDTRPESSKAPLAPRPRDTSRNLNGAVIGALAELDARLARAGARVSVGTLVVFSGGPDISGRVDDHELKARLASSRHSVFSIGIGERPDAVRELGRDGHFYAHSADTVSLAFEEAAHRVEAAYGQYYLFSYCSPARAKQRALRLELDYVTPKGEHKSGSSDFEFDATGFRPGCDPRHPPRLTVR
jgi:hypothetical protein